MADDRFKALETHEDATPGPWEVRNAFEVWSPMQANRLGGGVVDLSCEVATAAGEDAGDAEHIARWSPDVTAEIVELLKSAREAASRAQAREHALEASMAAGWMMRLDDLLERVGGKKP